MFASGFWGAGTAARMVSTCGLLRPSAGAAAGAAGCGATWLGAAGTGDPEDAIAAGSNVRSAICCGASSPIERRTVPMRSSTLFICGITAGFCRALSRRASIAVSSFLTLSTSSALAVSSRFCSAATALSRLRIDSSVSLTSYWRPCWT